MYLAHESSCNKGYVLCSLKVTKSKSLKAIESSLNENDSEYEWIKFNRERLEGEFVSIPEREQIPENIKEQLIVELYSK